MELLYELESKAGEFIVERMRRRRRSRRRARAL